MLADCAGVWVAYGALSASTSSQFPRGRDSKRVEQVLAHYESQTEDEAAFEVADQTVMEIPAELVPKVRQLIAKHELA
jgi:hypothetical protein